MTVKKIKNNTNKNITTVERTSNVSTVTTDVAHGFNVNQKIYVSCSDASYDVQKVPIDSVPTSTTFTYANTGSDDSSNSETGTAGILKKFRGQEIAPNSYYELQITEMENPDWVDNTDVHSDISSGDWVVNDGTSDLSSSDGLEHYKAKNATCIQGVLVDDSSKGDGKSLTYDNASGSIVYSTTTNDYQCVSSTTQASTSSGSWILMPSMTISSPSSGSYLVLFSTDMSNTHANGLSYFSVYKDGSIVADSERHMKGTTKLPCSVQTVVTVNGSEDIEVYWKKSGAGDNEVEDRMLTIVKIG